MSRGRCWGDDGIRVGNKSGATRLGFAVLLEFFELGTRFPRLPGEVPETTVGDVAEQRADRPIPPIVSSRTSGFATE